MKLRALCVAALIAAPASVLARDALTSLHPEAALPDETRQTGEDRYSDFIKEVQEKLRALDFDAGPVNGQFWTKTQAALAQFQLSRNLPASGMLDERTLAELGVEAPRSE